MCSVAQWCLTLWSPKDCSPPGSSAHGIFQARILKWGAISYLMGSSRPRDRTCVSSVSYIGRWVFATSSTWEALHIHMYIYALFGGGGPVLASLLFISVNCGTAEFYHGIVWQERLMSVISSESLCL